MTVVIFYLSTLMDSQALNMRPNGSITIPKEWRDQYATKHFIASVTAKGILLEPIVQAQYWEKNDGSFGVHFPRGIAIEDLQSAIRKSLKD